MTTPSTNQDRESEIHHLPIVAEYVLFAGCGISVLSILFVIIAYTANRYLRVKRQHMITINLCISLLIFYVGFILTIHSDFKSDVHHDTHSHDPHHVNVSSHPSKTRTDCIAGTIFLMLGWFYVHSWILAHWIFLCLTIQQSAPKHISNFFIKVSLCTYVPASIPAIIVIVMDRMDLDPNSDQHCFLELDKSVGNVFIVVTGLIFCTAVCCATWCTSRLTCARNPNAVLSTLKKNRGHLLRLIFLSLIIILSHVPHLVLWTSRDPGVHSTMVLEVVDGIIVGLHGILIVICLLYRGNRFCEYWSNVVSGRNPGQTASLRISRLNLSRSSKRGLSSNTADTTGVENSSTLERKMEPRESNIVEMTLDDEVFLSSSAKSLKEGEGTTKTDGQKKKPSVQVESSSNDTKFDKRSEKQPVNASSRSRLNSFRRKVLRASFRKSAKSSISSTNTCSPPPSPKPTRISTLNRIHGPKVRVSILGELERKTSF